MARFALNTQHHSGTFVLFFVERGIHGAAVILGVLNPTGHLRGHLGIQQHLCEERGLSSSSEPFAARFFSFSQLGGEPRGVLAESHDAQHHPLQGCRVKVSEMPARGASLPSPGGFCSSGSSRARGPPLFQKNRGGRNCLKLEQLLLPP